MFYSRLILFTLLLNSVLSRKICNYNDGGCVTSGANNVLRTMILGIEGVVETSDPIRVPQSEGEMITERVLKYKLRNSTMTGMKSCKFTYLTMKIEDSSFRFELLCDQIVLSHYFDAKGYIGPVEIDGKGYLDLKLNNYAIKFNGEYGEFISETDDKLHFNIKSCYQKYEPRGKMEVDIKSQLHSDKAKSDLAKTYLYEHPNRLEEGAHSPVLDNFMKVFVTNLNTYLRAVPADTLLPALIQTVKSPGNWNK